MSREYEVWGRAKRVLGTNGTGHLDIDDATTHAVRNMCTLCGRRVHDRERSMWYRESDRMEVNCAHCARAQAREREDYRRW